MTSIFLNFLNVHSNRHVNPSISSKASSKEDYVKWYFDGIKIQITTLIENFERNILKNKQVYLHCISLFLPDVICFVIIIYSSLKISISTASKFLFIDIQHGYLHKITLEYSTHQVVLCYLKYTELLKEFCSKHLLQI